MLNKSVFVVGTLVLGAVFGLLGQSLLAQSLPAQTWNLPQGTTVKDNGPRTYRFSVDYNTANTKGEIMHRQRLTGDYTRGLGGGEVMWKNVAQAEADGATAPFAAAQKRDFMEGFRYRNDLPSTLNPEFFKGFPPTAVFERNLVWDTGMIEVFGQGYFEHLKLNEPYHLASNHDVNMPDVGTFRNHDIVLEWIGHSQRNGQDCALITYKAFFNPLEIVNGGMTLKGRSDYWGEIWVSLETKQIEYGTIYENVAGEMKLPGQDTTQIINVFRIGSLEPVIAK
ncbi:MAG: hypothetical protein ABSF14_23930 [Terriglobia bacterium]|jgi:hypothetical protein